MVGVGFALICVGAVLIADELIPPHLRATGQALVKGTMFGLAPVAGTLGGGFIYGALGPQTLFILSAALAGAAGIVGVTAVSRRQAPVPILESEGAIAQAPV